MIGFIFRLNRFIRRFSREWRKYKRFGFWFVLRLAWAKSKCMTVFKRGYPVCLDSLGNLVPCNEDNTSVIGEVEILEL